MLYVAVARSSSGSVVIIVYFLILMTWFHIMGVKVHRVYS